ncbi:hypothetical protein [Halocatena marina]|uniref:hypothetical protein n=1 Tax=Halocatena marina TaxID=2934937 RepID=UPI00200CD2D3|nr:hypothetical protein [Halocatena marina]
MGESIGTGVEVGAIVDGGVDVDTDVVGGGVGGGFETNTLAFWPLIVTCADPVSDSESFMIFPVK